MSSIKRSKFERRMSKGPRPDATINTSISTQANEPEEHPIPGLPVQKAPAEARTIKDQVKSLLKSTSPVKLPDATDTKGYLSAVRGTMQQLAHEPSSLIPAITHPVGGRVLKAWLKNGAPDDLSVDHKVLNEEQDGKPISLEHLFPSEKGDWALTGLDSSAKKSLPKAGILLIHHGSANPHLDQVAKHTSEMNWGGLAKHLDQAVKGGHITEDQASEAVDRALPPPERAKDLPARRLLSVVAAASPAHRVKYGPLMKQRFGDLSSLPDGPRKELGNHLAMLGFGGELK